MAILILSILILVASLGFVLFGVQVRHGLNISNIFFASSALIYCLVPIYLTLDPSVLNRQGANWGPKFLESYDYVIFSAVVIFLFFTVVFISFRLFRDSGNKTFPRFLAFSTYLDKNCLTFGIAFTVIGLFSFLIYSTTAGGPVDALINAQLLRSGKIQESGPLTFFKHFMRISYLGTYCLFFLLISSNSFRFANFIFFVASLIVSLVIMWCYAGRAGAVIFLGVFLLYGVYRKKVSFSVGLSIALFFFLGLAIIAYLRPLIEFASGSNSVIENSDEPIVIYIFGKLVSSFSIAFASITVALESIDYSDLYYGKGVLLSFAELAPKRLFDFSNLPTINSFHTQLFGYVQDDRQYTITAGMITYFYIEYWCFGIILGGFLVGGLVGFLSKLEQSVNRRSLIGLIFIFYGLKIPAYILNSDPASIVKAEFPFLLCVFIIIVLYRFRYVHGRAA